MSEETKPGRPGRVAVDVTVTIEVDVAELTHDAITKAVADQIYSADYGDFEIGDFTVLTSPSSEEADRG